MTSSISDLLVQLNSPKALNYRGTVCVCVFIVVSVCALYMSVKNQQEADPFKSMYWLLLHNFLFQVFMTINDIQGHSLQLFIRTLVSFLNINNYSHNFTNYTKQNIQNRMPNPARQLYTPQSLLLPLANLPRSQPGARVGYLSQLMMAPVHKSAC